ncbi:50S ribosomal protein L19 [Chitinivibrio alkaliphilus]|uniref:Large ribosomal subunit protein bL19 n=1 Tax=Chitinivibrio alkaliphilus ACht1 TaxID=1313304 RepID=U7D5W4_9BACT|nr:50S ribosomal protein L19 [Chitinivibrio alkaliphilus]ERP30956.1 ribosomal protein L19 [Chitinivibrio alkaliphilus ACht1]
MDRIQQIEKEMLTDNHALDFRSGDVVNVGYQIKEGSKVRTQFYRGTVIQRKGSGMAETFTVRKASANGIFVERIFPIHSPLIESIEVVTRGKVRQSRIYYLRDRIGKAARVRVRDINKKN